MGDNQKCQYNNVMGSSMWVVTLCYFLFYLLLPFWCCLLRHYMMMEGFPYVPDWI